MSALPLLGDSTRKSRDVRNVPITEVKDLVNDVPFRLSHNPKIVKFSVGQGRSIREGEAREDIRNSDLWCVRSSVLDIIWLFVYLHVICRSFGERPCPRH